MKTMNLNTNTLPTTPNGDGGGVCFSSEDTDVG
jgi:hypothetical protein